MIGVKAGGVAEVEIRRCAGGVFGFGEEAVDFFAGKLRKEIVGVVVGGECAIALGLHWVWEVYRRPGHRNSFARSPSRILRCHRPVARPG